MIKIAIIIVIVHAEADDEDIWDHKTNVICEVVVFQVVQILFVKECRDFERGWIVGLEDTLGLHDG
jgi:hypothetical protein